jgi:4-hydroxythreonine-4-phosphate dehydrogenase
MANAADAPIMLTPGDPAGIGAEIALKAVQAGCHDFFLMDDVQRIESLSQRLNLNIPVTRITHPSAFNAAAEGLQVLDLDWSTPPVAGRPDAANAGRIIAAIETGVEWAKNGTIAALVTNPIAKACLYEAGFAYPGHTEFLGALSPPVAGGPAMMLACDVLKVVPVTVHIPLVQVPQTVTTSIIVDKAKLVASALKLYFGIACPRIAVCGLNPHAGESGTMGNEDDAIIAPAVAALQKEGIAAAGPYPADTLFHQEARKSYDVVLGMYHDQVLIPLKTLDFFGGVNITLGLDFVRTSPDHGTGFDIAGTGVAKPDSLIAAIATARKMAQKMAQKTPPQTHGTSVSGNDACQ